MEESIGAYLRDLRKKQGKPMRKVAAMLDIDQSTLSKIERNERPPKEDLLPKMADCYQIDLQELRLVYLSDRVLAPILREGNPEEILKRAKEKLKFIKDRSYNQGKLDL